MDQFATNFDLDEMDVIRELSSTLPESSGSTITSVHLSPVSTFIHSAKGGFAFGYVVASIVKHWGVFVGDSPKHLYHLVFQNQADARSDSNSESLIGTVEFDSTYWPPSRSSPPSTMKVGETRYSHNELIKIGMFKIGYC